MEGWGVAEPGSGRDGVPGGGLRAALALEILEHVRHRQAQAQAVQRHRVAGLQRVQHPQAVLAAAEQVDGPLAQVHEQHFLPPRS